VEPFVYRELAPAPALRRQVACYWTLRVASSGIHHVFPDGCADLLFDLGASRASVIGIMSRTLVSEPDLVQGSRTWLFGVRFLPGESASFVPFPAVDARDLEVDLTCVPSWGAFTHELLERLCVARSDHERCGLVDRALLARRLSAPDARVRRVVEQLRVRSGFSRIAELARDVDLGERQLERLFDAKVGLSPKALAKVLRFQAFLARAHEPQSTAELASAHGYADQSHLARDLRALTDLTPAELRALRMSDSSNPPEPDPR
jgi:AraC-like DNA-binding protein